MPLSTELKWLSTFKLISGQANYWFQNLIKSNTHYSNETHWVKLLNYTSSGNRRSCWATDKGREGPRTAGVRWPALGHKDMADFSAATQGQRSSSTSVPQLISYSDKQPSAYPTKGSAWPLQGGWKMRCPHSKHRQEARFTRADSKPQSIVSEFLQALKTSFKIW